MLLLILKICCVFQDHYDVERDRIVFHDTTPDLQDQDQDRFFSYQIGLVLRPTVSDYITGMNKIWQTTFYVIQHETLY